jgi:RimJ/RimL family protein N-acetyltransferase
MQILETERLSLRTLNTDDASFYLRLVNEPTWLQHIGNRGVTTLEQACMAIEHGPNQMFRQFGHCLYLVTLKRDGSPIGICGLIKRDGLDDVDLGYALLPEHVGQGYVFESASAVLQYAFSALAKQRVVAIVAPENVKSIRVVEGLGMRFERMITLTNATTPVRLYSITRNA